MIIFINGTLSSGKSTIAKLLANSIPNTANVEIDELRNFISWMSIDKSIPINLENAVSIIKNFVKNGLNVVVPYPLSQKDYEYLTQNLENLNTKIHMFTLNPDPEELLKSKRGRDLDNWDKQRIKHHVSIGLTTPSFGHIIDNTNQTPQETAGEILKLVDL